MRGPRFLPAPTIAYGAASIAPGGRGELNVPVKTVFKVCSTIFHTTKVNEGYTTKKHYKCHNLLDKVKYVGDPDSKALRGLCWCPTCSEFVNRDRNPCHNILAIAQANERPEYLQFGQPALVQNTLALLPRPVVTE